MRLKFKIVIDSEEQRADAKQLQDAILAAWKSHLAGRNGSAQYRIEIYSYKEWVKRRAARKMLYHLTDLIKANQK